MKPWDRPPSQPQRRPPNKRQQGDGRPLYYPQNDYSKQQRPMPPHKLLWPPPPIPPGHFPFRPPPPIPPPFASHTSGANIPRPPIPPPVVHTANSPLADLSVDEQMTFEKMVETYCRNPELVNMVKQSQRGNPKYHFLYEESSLNPYFQWRVNHQPERQAITSFERSMANANAVRPMPRPFCPPPVPPPEAIAGMRNENPAAAPQSAQKAHHLYHKLPAGLMLKLINEDHTPYSALRTRDLESTDFLDSVAPGLSSALSCTEKPIAPEMTSDLEQALDHFERGLCYIYKEGEFEDRDNPFASAASNDTHNVPSLPIMDKEGWESGVLEKLLWDRRRGGEERRKWKRKGDRAQRRLAGEDVSSSSQSSDDSDGSDSSSDSSGSDSSSASSSGSQSGQRTSAMRPSVNARGSSINTAIGSDNVGFKLLAKLGWQEGQGLGASNDGIIEPIRLQTRFSTIRNDKGKGSYRGRQRSRGGKKGNADKRASLGTGRLEDADATSALAAGSDQTGNNTNSKEFDAYRRQMSLAYSSHQNPPTSDDA